MYTRYATLPHTYTSAKLVSVRKISNCLRLNLSFFFEMKGKGKVAVASSKVPFPIHLVEVT